MLIENFFLQKITCFVYFDMTNLNKNPIPSASHQNRHFTTLIKSTRVVIFLLFFCMWVLWMDFENLIHCISFACKTHLNRVEKFLTKKRFYIFILYKYMFLLPLLRSCKIYNLIYVRICLERFFVLCKKLKSVHELILQIFKMFFSDN